MRRSYGSRGRPTAVGATRQSAPAPNLSGTMRMLTEERSEAAPAAGRAAQRARPSPSTAVALLVAMRPGEWIKNVLVFAGLVFAKKFNEPSQVVDAVFTFVAFCAISSAGY